MKDEKESDSEQDSYSGNNGIMLPILLAPKEVAGQHG